MHERTQRAVARLLFVFCCAVPTSFILLSILVTWTPWYQSRRLAEVTYRLCRETGLVFQIDRCDLVAPGKYILENVQIRDPETGSPVATIRVIEYLEDNNGVGLLLHQPEIQSAGLGRAWSLVHDRLISRPEHTLVPMQIAALGLTIHSRTGDLTLNDVRVSMTPESSGVRLTASSKNVNRLRDTQLRVDLFRDRSLPTPLTEVTLSTDNTALPCSALAEYLPLAEKLGPDAFFNGTVRCTERPEGWAYELIAPVITDIDVGRLTNDLPHRAFGKAELRLQRGLIIPGEKINLIGTLHVRDAWLENTLLAALENQLGLRVDASATRVDGLHCTLAAVHFDVTDQSLKLTGNCDQFHPGIGPGVAMYSDGRGVALTSGQPLRAQGITATFDPPGRSVAAWNQVFMPVSPGVTIATRPDGDFRRLGPPSNGPVIHQR